MIRRSWRVATVLIPIALLSGCGKTPESTDSAAAAPRIPQIYRVGNGADPQDLDPHLVTGVPEHNVLEALSTSLVGPDPRDTHAIPALAKSWDISPDGLTYTFHLRDNLLWSDGSPITTDDFLLSWKRLISPKLASEYAYTVYDYVVGARDYYDGRLTDFSKVGFSAPDDHTLVIKLINPTPSLINLIADFTSWNVIPIKTLLKYGALDERSTQWTRPGNYVGNGPFMLKEWLHDEKLVVVRNPRYWDAGHVKLDEVDFIPTEDTAGEERMFRAGQLDRTEDIPISKIETYRRDHPELLHIDPYLGVFFFALNVSRPPMGDRRVRRALSLGIDRESLIRNVLHAGQIPAYAFTPPDDAGYTRRAKTTGTMDDARRLLAEAGYPGGKGLPRIELLYNVSANNKQVVEAVQEMWRKNLGVDVELRSEEWKVYLDSLHGHNFQIARSGWVAAYADPIVFVGLLESSNGNNSTTWKSPVYDSVLHDALVAPNDEIRYENYQKLDQMLVDECPVIPVYYYTRHYLMSTKVKGFWSNSLDIHPLQDIYLEN